jgi:hypothetical protein
MSAIREMGHAGRYPIGICRATRCRDNAPLTYHYLGP